MIHNLQEEKNKLHRKQEAPSYGLSDGELKALIGQVENEGMIRAPIHLKSNVMTHIRMEKQTAKKRQVFTYRAQVLIAMAAAVMLLVLMPVGGSQTAMPEQMFLAEQEASDPQMEPFEKKAMKQQEKIDAVWADYQEKQEKARSRRELRESIKTGLEAFQVFLTNNYEIWRLIS